MAIIIARKLTKKYKDLIAVDNVSLNIEEGECFGLLGPNGAGKTSLIRMITAVSPPAQGEILIDGKNIRQYSRQVKAILGVVPQIDNLDEDLTVIQNLTTFARYFDIPRTEANKRALDLLKLFKIEDKRDKHTEELSGGMKRMLLIARGLINNPRIVILDEPTIGLDPQTRHLVWQKLQELRFKGVTELISTQNMEEADILCNRVAIMHLGKILALDTTQVLITRYVGEELLEIQLNSMGKDKIIAELASRKRDFLDIGNAIRVFHVDENELAGNLVNLPIKLVHRPATLEDVFFRLTGRTLAD